MDRVVCCGALMVCGMAGYAQEVVDTANVRNLDEVVVTSQGYQHLGDRDLFYPSKELKEAVNNGVQLLAGLQIPDLIINPATGMIEKLGSGKVLIKVNGRPVSHIDLLSISPKDILKVEYISNPGLQHGEATAVIDVNVMRRDSGYGLAFNLLQSTNRGWGNYSSALKYTIGRSEWSLDLHSNPMWQMLAFRDNSEHYLLADGSEIYRQERGRTAPNRMVPVRGMLGYSYAVGNKLLFHTQLRSFHNSDLYRSEGDIITRMGDEIVEDLEIEKLSIKSTQIDLDLYLHWEINKTHKLYFNVIPTITYGGNDRSYQTTDMDLFTTIVNRGKHLYGESVWEWRIGRGRLSSGVKHLNEWTEARYIGDVTLQEISVRRNLFSEWKHALEQLQYSIGIGGDIYSVVKPVQQTYWNVNSRIYARYSPESWWSAIFTGNVTAVSPTVNQLNPTMQQIDRYQWNKGNIHSAPFQKFDVKLEIDGQWRDMTFILSANNIYSHRPIMGAKTYFGNANAILNSLYNTGYHNNLIIKGQLRTPLFIKQLRLSVDGGWHTVCSEGRNYHHEYSQPFVNAQLMLMSGAWWIMLKYNSAYNQLWGEEIQSVNKNMFNFGIGYTAGRTTFMAGVFNPIGNISVRTRDLSSLAGYDRQYQVTSTQRLLWVGVSMDIYYGKKRGGQQRKLNNQKSYESINNVKK